MKKYYLLFLIFSFVTCCFIACTKTDDDYTPIVTPTTKTELTLDLSLVPFPKLSDYNFFTGLLKNQSPAERVLPYEPASSLFADYAHKKRFVWMPKSTVATYNGDDNVFEFPVGAVLIKTFYYDNVQPDNVTKIIETRLLVLKSDGWKAYDYIWNESQTEAFLAGNNGSVVPVTFTENGVQRSVNYETPSQAQCLICHKINPTGLVNGEKVIPIGPKPQNLNTLYNYNGTSMNQIAKWRSMGFLGNDVPATINSTINWKDTTQPLEKRARSYIDINCAHCHRLGGHCDYAPQRFNFSNNNLNTFGICLEATNDDNGKFVINGGNAAQSAAVVRMSSQQGSVMMPYIGRTIVDEEGVQLMKDWINTLPRNCR